MTKFVSIASRSVFVLVTTAFLTAAAQDLSKYRDFQFGTDLPTVTKGIGGDPGQPKLVHSRPALMQELDWRPRSLGPSPPAESVDKVTFSFYNGALYRIDVKYDRNATEGLTTDDFVDGISAVYGPAAKVPPPVKPARESYGYQEEIVTRWEDPQYRFELRRASYGPTYSLVGVLKSLEARAQAANLEAKRLDDLEAPQREAAREAAEQNAKAAILEKARLANKPRFRP